MKFYKKDWTQHQYAVSKLIMQYIPEDQRNVLYDMDAGIGDVFQTINFYHPFNVYFLNTELSLLSQLRKKTISQNAILSSDPIFEYCYNLSNKIDLAILNTNCFTLKREELIYNTLHFLEVKRPSYFMVSDHASIFYRFKKDGLKTYGAQTYFDYINKLIQTFDEISYEIVDFVRFSSKRATVFLFKNIKE